MMDRRAFRKNVFWGWVAAGASLVPATAPVDASQPAATLLAMISCAPAAADPSPNSSDLPPDSTLPVRTAGHLFAPPPIPKRLADIDALIAEPGRTQTPSPSVRLAPSLLIPAKQTPPSSDILRRLPKTDPLSDEPLAEPLQPELPEPEPGILPPAADNALQLDNNEPLMMVPAESGDGPVALPADRQSLPELAPPEQRVSESSQADDTSVFEPRQHDGSRETPSTDESLPSMDAPPEQPNASSEESYTSPVTLQPPVLAGPVFAGPVFAGPVFDGPVLDGPVFRANELTPEEYTPAELAPEELTSEDASAVTEPGPSVELSPPIEISQSSLGPDVSAWHSPPPPVMFASPGNDAVTAESLSSVAGSLMHLPPVEPEAPPAALRAERDRGVRLAPPREETTQNAIAMTHHVTARIRNAENLMARGACFAARAEMLQALKAIAQSLDERDGTRRHGDALAFALRAFQEAGDLTPRGSGLASPVNLDLTIRGHRTPVLWNENVNRLTPVAAQQRYMAYAQEQLVEACRGEMVASETLYILARINTVLENEKPESSLLCLPQAMVMFRAALEIDPRHGRAANELGVLLAGCGRYAEARDVLLHSVSVSPTPESWHNLSVVHARLGNAELAQRAQQESTASVPPRGTQPDDAMRSVKWVDPETFRADEQAAPTASHTRR